jgi:hypothetical protein
MLALITFCILFFFSAFAASGAAKLIMTLTAPGQLFSRWQKILNRLEPREGQQHFFLREFWYKRLGGCDICLRQFIAELSFVLLCVLYTSYCPFPTTEVDILPLRWLINAALFVGYCGTVLQIGQWMECKSERKNAEENIIETIYRKN